MIVECLNLGIVHRGVKNEDRFDDTDHLKLIDFGCATFRDHAVNGTFHAFAGTLAVAPPGWFNGPTYRAELYTVWQLGCLLFNTLCCDVPFHSDDEVISANIP
jgi:serine/threonine protein kinase